MVQMIALKNYWQHSGERMMSDKLKEIRERHEKKEGILVGNAHLDRGELLKMVEELEAQLDAVRNEMLGNECQNTYGKQNKPCGMCLFCSIQQALQEDKK